MTNSGMQDANSVNQTSSYYKGMRRLCQATIQQKVPGFEFQRKIVDKGQIRGL